MCINKYELNARVNPAKNLDIFPPAIYIFSLATVNRTLDIVCWKKKCLEGIFQIICFLYKIILLKNFTPKKIGNKELKLSDKIVKNF